LGQAFFGLTSEHKVEVHKLLFMLSYYSNGAFTFQDVYNMPVYLRTFYTKQLEDAKTQEAEASKPKSRPKSNKR
jgi:hypothetical protein